MAQDYAEYLAINVLNEQQLISYRSLSRALKVHVNLAKQMLYEFHRKQNAKKPGSVHATYLITGIRREQTPAQTNGVHSQKDGEDTVMQSSPPLPESSAPVPEESAEEPVVVRSVLLVKEEHLAQAKTTFESITGIHIYSLQANGLNDVQSLTECNRKIAVDYASEDPLVAWKQYGTIQNPNVKRRTARKGPPPAAPVTKPAEVKLKQPAPAAKSTVPEKQASKDSNTNSQDSTTAASKRASKPPSAKATPEPTKKPAAVKRQDSNIFMSFAKGKTKPQKEESQSSVEAATPAAEPEDETMAGFSDEEDDAAEEGAVADVGEVANEPEGKSKRQREAELEAMMDQEDEVMEDASPEKSADGDEGAIDKPNSQHPQQPAKDTIIVENGRRRGRRRVMKKKTVKDEDGYLVTKEEQAWESFSEEEPPPKKIKAQPAASTNKSAAAKKDGKPGQGNIMSFFGKK
ncbi:hypothetical protein LTR08_009202 [Meristemomyces frigidus]|nr:hypothetical protein LTR08_009202 [Meristemomyces frigidus]